MIADEIQLSDEQSLKFKQNVNMALMLSQVSLSYISRAEDIAREAGGYRLNVKTSINNAFNATKRITSWTDKHLDKGEVFYNCDVRFIDRLMQLLIDNVSDTEKQG